jgi:GDP/UDP-N,N'-diacetylbacillosamine 2-epimerase (hydrolysing)
MIKICVVTGTRAEYGQLFWTMKEILNDPDLVLQVCATGMHLSPEFGLTYKDIENDGIHIDYRVEMLLSSDSAVGITKSIGLGMIGFADAFELLKPDIVLVLGDRFEIFAAVAAAMISRIPVAHCHGGELTEGSIDDPIRHSITKMSHLHFTSTETYRKRVIQLGENPLNVRNVGALGIENINKMKLFSRVEFEESIHFKLATINFLITFHPVTLDENSAGKQFGELLDALKSFPEAHIIFTKPNSDTGGRVIGKMIDKYVSEKQNTTIAFTSLGQRRYLSAISHVDVVIGNSSSGLVEVPSFKKATVNIGDRQRGRIAGESVIQCDPTCDSIKKAIEIALSEDFKSFLGKVKNLHGEGNSSNLIVDFIKKKMQTIQIKKEFYNLDS